MYRILDCIAYEHQFGLLSLAVVSCVIGAQLTVLLTRRMLKAAHSQRIMLLILVSIIGGATIWSTHFIAMLAYEPGVKHGYEPVMTLVSLAVAVLGLLVTNALAVFSFGWAQAFGAGTAFGLTVSTMHYVGMSAYQLPGHLVWEPMRVLASVGAGAALGSLAYHRMVRPKTRFCWIGATILMILTICAMHFTGMSAFTIQLESSVFVPDPFISEWWFGVGVVSVTGLLYLLGFFSFRFDLDSNWRLQFAQMHDPLTGLPNRTHLFQQLEDEALKLDVDRQRALGVLMLDVEGFKEINGLYGRAVGDSVLQVVANRLSEAGREGEWVARAGSDEFVVLTTSFETDEDLQDLGNRLRNRLYDPIEVQGAELPVRIKVGIASTLTDGREPEGLLRKAEVALNHAKLSPGVNQLVFREELEQRERERGEMITDLRRALENNEFALVYQRQNALDTLDLVGFEVLIRWDHATKGRIPPNAFIPLAEETGLIRDIGQWVLRTACQEAASWPRNYGIAVNVAPQQLLQASFVDQVALTLEQTGLDPSRLELEVTEATVIDDIDFTRATMTRLKRLGVRIAMDDFGTGYSSLATLRAFPFDQIKIDRSFIKDVHENRQNAAIVRSTLLLGEALDIPVLAEGAETSAEIEFLQAEKCDFVQGYYFGRPMSRDEMRDLVFGTAVQSRSA